MPQTTQNDETRALTDAKAAFARGDYAFVRRVTQELRSSRDEELKTAATELYARTRPSLAGTILIAIAATTVLAITFQWIGYRP